MGFGGIEMKCDGIFGCVDSNGNPRGICLCEDQDHDNCLDHECICMEESK